LGKTYWVEAREAMSRKQQQDKEKLLENLAKTPIVEVACKQADVPRSTYYRWRKEDGAFAEACDEAIETSSSLINDMAESQLIAAIKDKNLTAIIYWLKHHHPKYAARIELDAHIHHDQQELSPEQAEIVAQALRLAGLIKQPEGETNDGN
jgi:Mg/Co/Ni transporter MgtE